MNRDEARTERRTDTQADSDETPLFARRMSRPLRVRADDKERLWKYCATSQH